MVRPIFTRPLIAALVVSMLTGAAPAPSGESAKPGAIADRPNQVRGDEITEKQRLAVEKGLSWLAARQAKDGSFAANNNYGAQSAITSLAALAFMSAGNLPGRGKYGDNVSRALDYILRSAQESGLLAADQAHGLMYSHGFATLFLGEVYGMTGDERCKEKLQKAVRLIEQTQNKEGGWRYNPVPYDADISVTICQVMGLRAAKDAGIDVRPETMQNAIKYVRRCKNADGGFSYTANMGGGGGSSGFERSAAGVAALYYAGVFEGDDLASGLKYLMQFLPSKNHHQHSHRYYGHYYAVQAMFLAGGDYWAQWYPAIRDELVEQQDPNTGAWSGEVSEEYCTAIALIVLQMPNRYLPVFNGKGPGN